MRGVFLQAVHRIRDQKSHHAWMGAAWKIAAFACYAGLDGVARYLSGGVSSDIPALPVYEIVFFQDLIAFMILLPWYFKSAASWRLTHLPIHLLRGVFSGVAVITWYFALFYLPLSDAVALSIIGPVMGVLIANWILKEKLNVIRIALISTSFIATLFIMQTLEVLKANQANRLGILFVLISAFCFAVAKISTRMLAQRGCGARMLTLSLLLFIIPVSLIPALSQWTPVSMVHLGWLSLAGLLTVFAIYCVSKALVFAEITFLAPFDICRFLFNTIVGYLAFTELPKLWALSAMMVVFALIAWNIKRSESRI